MIDVILELNALMHKYYMEKFKDYIAINLCIGCQMKLYKGNILDVYSKDHYRRVVGFMLTTREKEHCMLCQLGRVYE